MVAPGEVFILSMVICAGLPALSIASCERLPVEHEPEGMPFCVYKTGTEFEPMMMALLPGSHYVDETKCMNCTCSETQLECCGYGIKAGVIHHASCRPKMIDSCNFVFVREDNDDVLC